MSKKKEKEHDVTGDMEPGMNPLSPSHLLLYRTEDGRHRIEVRLEEETVWMTQATMAELFQTCIHDAGVTGVQLCSGDVLLG